jgi:beta-aspartyl-peptidase (threonine type)
MTITSSIAHDSRGWVILVHGGAGAIEAERQSLHAAGCAAAARAGAAVLANGGTALDAVQRAVEVLEDDPSFNAGTGASLNEDGEVSLDASIMEGTSLRAGGVAALSPFNHPIAIARAVLEDGEHVLYAGTGADAFAHKHGFSGTTHDALKTERSLASWSKARTALPQSGGTVGAVAVDAQGAVAAATSTGGKVRKRRGRVGDSPIVGAGTYADDEAGACSNTGDGESVLRLCLGKEAVERLRAGELPEDAARAVILRMHARLGGSGGIIVVDRHGRAGAAWSTPQMAWAMADSDGVERSGT